jgi:ABC-type branched-subunit amino acid transport system ATPase component
MNAKALQAEEIVAGYGAGAIVKGVTVSVDSGRLVVLLGPNGAGKSTLLKAIVRLVKRTSGVVRLRDEDVSNLQVNQLTRKGVSYVPQLLNVFTTLTVRENLEIGGYIMRSGVRSRIDELLEIFPQLQKALGRTAGTLSGGERSLLALAKGLMSKPDVLLIDEPTAGLSPQSEQIVWDQLDVIRRSGVATLVVEQNVAKALEYADWAYVLVVGEKRLEGKPSELAGTDVLASLYIGGSRNVSPQPSVL